MSELLTDANQVPNSGLGAEGVPGPDRGTLITHYRFDGENLHLIQNPREQHTMKIGEEISLSWIEKVRNTVRNLVKINPPQ